jgi:superfamily I DNA/RNA helicase/RecB family exonuclease
MPAEIEFVPALPGRPATDRLLDLYRSEVRLRLAEASAGETLWISPTHRSRDAIHRNLLNDSLPVCVRPNIVTFDRFAGKVLRDSSQVVSGLSPWLARSLLRILIDRLATSGRLKHFGPIAYTAGFLDVVASLIAELKRGETWPEQFETSARAAGLSPRDRELAMIYREYQSELVARNWYDAEGAFWSARQALRDGEWNSFASLSLVVVDGFSDFTPTQYEILTMLAGRADRMLVSLPWEQPLVRGDLFAKPATARQRLLPVSSLSPPDERVGVRRPGDHETIAPRSAETPEPPLTPDSSPQGREGKDRSPALRWIADNLFRNSREVRPATDAAGVAILTAAGPLGEAHAVAARVKQLLLGGGAPDDVIVCVRDLDEYADVIDEIFTAAGIPFACDSGVPWSRLPEARAVVSLLQLEAEDWPFRRLLDWLDSPCFVPGADWPLPPGGLAAGRRAVASELRRMKLPSGRQSILDGLVRVAQADSRVDAAPSPTRIAHTLLSKLSDVLAPLRNNHDFAGWVDTLAAVLRDCGFRPDSVLGSQHSAISALLDALFATARVERQLASPRTITLGDFVRVLTDLLAHSSQSRSDDEAGRVRVLDAAQSRHLDVPYLFVAGLTEGSFPRLWRDDCLYSEAERRRLNEHGLALGHQTSRMQDEMLLFFEVVTRAKRQLVLSYPAISSSGEPLSPSPYLLAVQELFDPTEIAVHRAEQLDPVPPRDRILTATDARIRAVQDVLDGDAALFATLCEAEGRRIEDGGSRMAKVYLPSSILHSPSSSTAATCRSILAAADMAQRRFASRRFTDFEGQLALPASRQRLAGRFGPEVEFSATQLERYAVCPFKFFAQDVLGLAELESPEMEISSQQRGIIVHEVLAKLHREMLTTAAGSLTLAPHPHSPFGGEVSDVNQFDVSRRFRELLHDVLWRRPAATELQAALREIEERVLAEWGVAYAKQWQAYQDAARAIWSGAPVPSLFETAFGHAGGSTEETPEAAKAPCLVIGSGAEAIRIGGRIDRIDVGVVDGRRCFTVIDYKTGNKRAARLDDIASGRDLQLALYALAVERLGLAAKNVRPIGLGYWLVRDDGFVFGLKGDGRGNAARFDRLTDELWQSLQSVLHDVVPRLATGIRAGSFPVFNEDEDCTSRCPFSTICRVNQIRPLAEALGKVPDGGGSKVVGRE